MNIGRTVHADCHGYCHKLEIFLFQLRLLRDLVIEKQNTMQCFARLTNNGFQRPKPDSQSNHYCIDMLQKLLIEYPIHFIILTHLMACNDRKIV